MPWPALLLWGVAAVTGVIGIKKGFDAHRNNDSAKEIINDANKLYNYTKKKLEEKRIETQNVLEELGKLKVDVFTNQINHLVEMHKKFYSKLEAYNQEVYIDNMPSVEEMIQKSLKLTNGSASGGQLAAVATLGAVKAFTAASTGSALSSLGGVAASKATLAWLGGGSLAAGGFGATGGMVALGGIALAPLLAIGGFWVASKAEENLTKAYQYRSEVHKAVEQIKIFITMLDGILTASSEMTYIIKEMVDRFEKVKVYDNSDKNAFCRMFQVGKDLKMILDISIINEDSTGKENIRVECSGYLELGICK